MKTRRKALLPVVAQLRVGDRGEAVEVLQKYLQRFGYLRTELPDDDEYADLRAASGAPVGRFGEFDAATLAALENYQRFFGLPVTGQADEATVTQMALPRCGCPDVRRDIGITGFVRLGGSWPRTNLTYGIRDLTNDIRPAQLQPAFRQAFDVWSAVTTLTFTEVPIAAGPDLVIRFAFASHGDPAPFDGVGNVLAHASPPPPHSRAGNIHFDDAETWTADLPPFPGSVDLVTVAIHEIGHALGLDHTPEFDAIMFPGYGGPRRYLGKDDIDGIRSLYPWGWDIVYAQGDPGAGIGGFDLASAADRIVPIDYLGTGSLTHLFVYRPGTGMVRIVKNTAGSFGLALVGGGGIGGYNLLSAADRAPAFDYEGSGRLDDLVLYRPGTGTLWILQNSGGAFRPVYREGDPGAGIAGYDLKSADDRVFAYDAGSSGRLDTLVLYRPGTGTIWMVENEGGSFNAFFRSSTGLGSFDLKAPEDRAFAFDYRSSGQPNHVVLYRPGSGAVHIQRLSRGVFSPVFTSSTGIGGFDFMSPDDRMFAYDYDGTGKLDHLVAYRPGTGTLWVLKNSGGAFASVYRTKGLPTGLMGYDLRSTADRAFAFDYAQKGTANHLALYRPGRGAIYILKPEP